MKKKKKKKKSALDLVDGTEDATTTEAPSPSVGDDDVMDFSKIKKARKKKSPKEENPASTDSANDSTSAAIPSTPANVQELLAATGGEESWQDSDRDYTYHELLARVFRTIRQHNPEFTGDRRQLVMIPPRVAREGSKKTAFGNFAEVCNRMHRNQEHFMAYIFAELGTEGSVDGESRLLIRGRFVQQQIEKIVRSYITEYVQCKTCKSPDTTLEKRDRLNFVQCASCGSARTVSGIKSGFKAQTGKRSKLRQG